jgi:CheY-like chemotaxis protein
VAPGDFEDPSVNGRFVRLVIADTGGGMDEQTRQRALEPFFTTKSAAVGLGLSTAMSVLRGIGGYITLQSEPRIGTTVQLYLPAAEPDATAAPPVVTAVGPAPATVGVGPGQGDAREGGPVTVVSPPTPAATQAPARPQANPDPGPQPHVAHVLVVEDQPELAQLIHRLLEPAGYVVTVSTNAETAIDTFATIANPTLLITDVVMPGMTGPELAAAMRDRHPGLPVLYMSGYTAAALGPQVHLDENSALVEKPFNRSTLLTAVERFTRPA